MPKGPEVDAETPNAFVTGASSGIGAETAKSLAASGFDVILGYREKAKRAQKVADVINGGSRVAQIVGGDITDAEARSRVIEEVSEWATEIDALVLNAAGGIEPWVPEEQRRDYAMNVNRDAQLALTEGLIPIMMPDATVVYVTSHWAHMYGQVEMPPFPGYEIVASTKFAGENDLHKMLTEREIRIITVTGGIVTDTAVGDMGVRRYPEFELEQRAIKNVVSAQEMGERIAGVIVDKSIPSGHVEVVGADLDTFLEQSGLEK